MMASAAARAASEGRPVLPSTVRRRLTSARLWAISASRACTTSQPSTGVSGARGSSREASSWAQAATSPALLPYWARRWAAASGRNPADSWAGSVSPPHTGAKGSSGASRPS